MVGEGGGGGGWGVWVAGSGLSLPLRHRQQYCVFGKGHKQS